MATSLDADPLLSAVPELRGFKVLPPAILYDRIGVGGMGAVYRGKHYNLEVEVAVKCLKASLSQAGGPGLLRFQREAKLAASIIHPNLIHIYDVASASGVHYLVMEFVAGETVSQRIRRKGPLGEGEAVAIALGAAHGLAAAHGKKIVHRDVKPDNILISHEGVVKLADLGIARAMDNEEFLTMTTGQIGTPQYMPPEQWTDASKVAPAADVWALGATLYYLLTGDNAIQATTQGECAHKICNFDFPSVAEIRPDLDPRLLELIDSMTRREQEERPVDAGVVVRQLREVAGVLPTELAFPPQPVKARQAHLKTPPPTDIIAEIRSDFATAPGIRPAPITSTVLEDQPEPRGLYEPPSSDWRPTPTHPGETASTGGGKAKWAAAAVLLLAGAGGGAWWWQSRTPAPPQEPLGLVEEESPPAVAAGPKFKLDGGSGQGVIHTFSRRYRVGGNLVRPNHQYFSVTFDGERSDQQLMGTRFEHEVELNPNSLNVIQVQHDSAMVEVLVQHDDRAPGIRVNEPLKSARLLRTSAAQITIELDEDHPADVWIGGAPATRDGDSWLASVDLPKEGLNRVELRASDQAGNETVDRIELVVDTVSPSLRESRPGVPAIYPDEEIQVALSFSEPLASVSGGLGNVSLGEDGTTGTLVWKAPAAIGLSSVPLQLTDLAGNEAQQVVDLLVEERPPLPVIALVQGPPRDASTFVSTRQYRVDGRVSNAAQDSVEMRLAGQARAFALDPEGRFTARIDLKTNANNRIELRHGEAEPVIWEVIHDSTSPVLTVHTPETVLRTPIARHSVEVSVDEPHLERVTLAGSPMIKRADGRWTGVVQLVGEGQQSYEVSAFDAAGNSTSRTLNLTLDTQGPVLTSISPFPGSEVARSAFEVELVFDEPVAWLEVNGVERPVDLDRATFPLESSGDGAVTREVRLAVKDELGNVVERSWSYALPEVEVVAPSEPEQEPEPEPEAKPEPPSGPPPGEEVDRELQAAGFRPSGLQRNALGYPQTIIHVETGGELSAVPFESQTRPRFYVWTREVTRGEFQGKDSSSSSDKQPKTKLTGQAAYSWCLARGLNLPTVQQWNQIRQEVPFRVAGISGKTREWLRFKSKVTDTTWPYVSKPDGSTGKTSWKSSLSSLGFRAVLELP